MLLHKIKDWLKRTPEEQADFENVICKNCKNKFDGHFCPKCGQPVKEYDKPLSFIFFNFVGDFFAFDTRFFRTIGTLLFKPGSLTLDFFKGKRVRYAPPFRVFIFVSFILFLLLQVYTNRGLTKVLDSSLDELTKNGAVLDSGSVAALDSVVVGNYQEIRSEIGADSIDDGVVDSEIFENTRDIRQGLALIASNLEKNKLENETDPKKRAKLREAIAMLRSPEQATIKILEYMSWAFFLLLPVFALILKLFYIRRKQNYIRHLVFSIHIHSFIFIIITLIIGLHMMLDINIEIVTSVLLLSIPLYIVIALKRFYGQKVIKVILKFIGITFLYNIIFWIMIVIVFLNALSII
ncbi:MAG: DUF3667 domain-containing protein [Bacteroidota bacterium]